MVRENVNYPELQGAPALCTDQVLPYYRIDPAVVRAAYQSTDEVEVEVEGVLTADDSTALVELFLPLQDDFEDAGEGSLGWESDKEMDFHADVRLEASDVVTEAGKYTGGAADQVREMALDAIELLDEIDEIYEYFHTQVVYTLAEGGAGQYGLSVHLEDFETLLVNPPAGWDQMRWDNRDKIRETWDYALSLLWCAYIGLAQLEAQAGNKAIHGQGGISEQPGTSEPFVPGVQSVPSTPPPPGGLAQPPTAPEPPGGYAPEGPEPDPDAPGDGPWDDDEPGSDDDTGDTREPSTTSSAGGGAAALVVLGLLGFVLFRKK